MKEKLTTEEYKEIERLAGSALNAPNKAEAQKYISKIKSFGYGLEGRVGNIFNELVCCVENASGRVTDKDNKAYYVTMELSKLRTYGVEK